MSESPHVIQITLPLKNWEKYSHSFEANKCYCKSKIEGFKAALNKLNAVSRFNSKINGVYRIYKLCLDMLVLAETCGALITSLYHTKKDGTVFEFKFSHESTYNEFYQELLKSFESYNLIKKA